MVWLSGGKREGVLGRCLERYFKGMVLEDAWGEVPVERCLTKGDRRRCLGKDALAKVL
jgi:hypothetical protein